MLSVLETSNLSLRVTSSANSQTTHLIVPASNETSRSSELHDIQSWAQDNNLKLNCDKPCEVIFTDPKRRRPTACRSTAHSRDFAPPKAPDAWNHSDERIRCDRARIQELMTKSAQTLYALRVLRKYGLSDATLQKVHRSVVVARLLYAASAWLHEGI